MGISELISVVVGFALGHVPAWFDRRRRIKTHWHSLRAEALLCKKAAEGFLSAKIAAPLYRLPTVAFERAFPILISEGAATEEELMALSRFVSMVQELNRGLEDASAFAKTDHGEHLARAHGRNILKAEALLEPRNNEPALALEALRIIDAKIAQPRWKY